MLTINVICIGKIKEKFFRDAIDEYSKRLSKYCKLNILELPDEKIPDKTNLNIENEIHLLHILSHLAFCTYQMMSEKTKDFSVYYKIWHH